VAQPLAPRRDAGCFCLTEPHAGSDASAADHRSADGDTYVLNGVKQFITSGKNGDVSS
jgi:butyryl-CoA dehydrogenase